MGRLWRRNPAIPFSETPFALPFCLIFEVVEHAGSVLYVIFPLSDKSIAACPSLGTSSLHLSTFEFSFIDGLVRPHHLSFTLHVVVFELSFVKAARVSEVVLSDAMELTINEITFVVATFKLEPAFTGLLALDEVTCKLDLVIVPGFSTESMLLIVLPLAFVH